MKLVGVVAFVVALLGSVMLHEFGHFWTARRYGMKATQFFLGFGPTLFSRQRGETEFGIKALPAGGFVKIIGMTDLEEVDPADEPRAFYRQPPGRRAIVLVAGSTMHFIIAIVLVYLAVLVGGVVDNNAPVLSAPAQCVATSSTQTSCPANATPSPAEKAGVREGDRVISVAGAPVTTFDQFATTIRSRPAGPVEVTVVRDGKTIPLTVDLVRAKRASLTDATKTVEVSVMGIGQGLVVNHPGPIAAVGQAGSTLKQLTTGTFSALGSLPSKLSGIFSPNRSPQGAVGVVGIGRISGDIAAAQEPLALRIGGFLMLIAGLNFFVGVFNLLPLMPLDGGHLAVLGYEQGRDRLRRLRGYTGPLQRVDLQKLMPLTLAVVAVFALMSVLILGADIFNPINLSQ